MKRLTSLLAAAAFAVMTAACAQTDTGITTKIKADMAQDDVVKANDINVTTRDHVVTLSGTVDSSLAKEQAMRIARGSKGVTDVVDDLRVREAAATTGSGEGAGAPGISDDIERGADKTKNVFEKAADKTVDGAKKVGSAVKGAVTDDNPDSNHDGK